MVNFEALWSLWDDLKCVRLPGAVVGSITVITGSAKHVHTTLNPEKASRRIGDWAFEISRSHDWEQGFMDPCLPNGIRNASTWSFS